MEIRPFLVYKSSAGSGKTYTLVKEYLKIILKEPQKIRNILAITFTNAAAAEMKERVIEALGDLSALAGKDESQWKGKGRGLLDIIRSETELQPFEIIRRAQQALTLILHNYGDFSISTIDSFVHRVIRSFAFDLRLPLNFDVELDQAQLLRQAVDILVSRAGSDPALTRLLVQFIEHRTDQEKSHYIEYDIINMANNLMDEKGSVYVERLKSIGLDEFGRIHRELEKRISVFEKSVSEIAKNGLKLIQTSGIELDMFYRGKTGIGTWFHVLAEGQVENRIQPNSYVITTIEDDKWTAGKADAAAVAAIDSIKPDLKDLFYRIQDVAEKGLDIYKLQKLVKQNLFPMAVLSELEKVIDEIKSENSVLPISDFNKRISEIVAVETAPFIYERIGERFQHYMIDEFQDTSGLQWQNLLPLVDNSLASGNMNLVVGDGKQAIYRWRNGDVEQFAYLPEIPKSIQAQARDHWQATLERNYQEQALDTNYRSRQEIIQFNNSFFEFAKSLLPPGLDKIYVGQEQKYREDKPGGFIHMEFVNPESEDDELSYQELTRMRILETIQDLQFKGHPLNDITILCRANAQASAIARFLLENGLNVISSESLLLSQSPKVNFMISVMKLINNPADHTCYVEFLQFLVKSRKISHSLPEALGNIQQIWQNKESGEHNSQLLENYLRNQGIDFSFSHCRHLGLYELAETVLQKFLAEKTIDPFVAFFMDVIYDYSNKFISSASGFLEWWEKNAEKFSVVVPEGVDAVQVMTIHKSKGLQFPVVIYPFADVSFGKLSKNGQWIELEDLPGAEPLEISWIRISKALQETSLEYIYDEEQGKTLLDILNVMYVAFTRAVDKLFVFTKLPGKTSKSDNVPSLLVNFLAHRNMFSEGENIYAFGENHSLLPSEDYDINRETSADVFREYISSPWTSKVNIRSLQLEKKPVLQSEESSERGSWMHDIMEKIHTPKDAEKVLKQLQQTGQVDETEKERLQSQILSILNNPVISPWYADGLDVRNECGMYDEKGRYFRADRVVLQDTMAVIIDYKTGDPYPHHTRQINNYASIIKKMGYSDIKKYIVYLDHDKIELV
ncbi:MAG: UvrD-helicase domain-containing protein [Bacteroidales bacterium]|nr:UvrD-helicase domain-containing protein [Bacteroidales bacterium]